MAYLAKTCLVLFSWEVGARLPEKFQLQESIGFPMGFVAQSGSFIVLLWGDVLPMKGLVSKETVVPCYWEAQKFVIERVVKS